MPTDRLPSLSRTRTLRTQRISHAASRQSRVAALFLSHRRVVDVRVPRSTAYVKPARRSVYGEELTYGTRLLAEGRGSLGELIYLFG